ncbi:MULTISPECIES: lysophospholipid acyltransferase family protein [Clavibacter]|uniref:Glycerol acyltransferase n=1 Tax=Clavibacter tessellarius TaxID=31965 RepID=A0A154UYC5_9MICO|nr:MULTISPECIES: lysophospholipid acyltransferase family protein [Clavibacter]KZC94132.1 glycerol acyltransferase [Clavibacter michiganensis subsp. tessellarius]MDA3804285.1 lysophospholipid acyltransferase family protein [Clavibacter sp. CT19]
MSRLPREPVYGTAVILGRALFGSLRLRLVAEGRESIPDTGGAVIAMTHFGYLEFALVEWATWLHHRRRIRFLAKKGAFDQPGVGWVLRRMRHISVDMGAGAAAYADAVRALRSGELVGVFPEAGVSASFRVRELKTGAARLAAEAGVPVIPVAVWGGHRLLTKNRRIRLRDRVGVPVHVRVGEPIAVAPDADPRQVTDALRVELQSLVDALQDAYPVDGRGAWWQPRHRGGAAPTPEEAAAADAERDERRRRRAEGR